MTPGKYPLKLYRGDTYSWQFVFWTDAEKTIPADLSSVTAKSEIRDTPGGALVIPLACAISLPNTINAKLGAAGSALLPPTGVWDLQLTYTTGDIATVLAGPVTATPDVTDSTPAPTQTKLRAVS